MTEWNGDLFMLALRVKAAEELLRAADFFASTLSRKVSRPSPFSKGPRGGRVYYDPSKPGEYPKLRTGSGQKAITYQPTTIAEVINKGYVRVGYIEIDSHLLALEFGQARKGLIDLLDEMQPQLAELALAAFKDDR